MNRAENLEAASEAFEVHEWSRACEHLEAAAERAPLDHRDLERLAVVRYLLGRELDSIDTWARASRLAHEQQDRVRAARGCFWAGFVSLNRGDLPAGNGWIARAERELDEVGEPLVEAGYVRYLVALRAIFRGDDEGSRVGFEQAARIGRHFGDPDIETLARIGQGRALIRLGRADEAVACLDEAMIAVTGGEVSPVIVGDSYCAAIEGCQELFDLDRARRWTDGLSRWCEEQPALVTFRGQCLIHRAEILQFRGSWPDAMSEVDRALERLARPTGQLAIGAAHYERGELHRLRGEFEEAEAAYREADRHGRQAQPGLALLRLAQGALIEAGAGVRRALAETEGPARSRLLPAAVEVLLAVGDLDGAATACDELEATAAEYRSRMLDALAAGARGAVQLAADEPDRALPTLRASLERWQTLDVPYEAARARTRMGQAYRQLGDHEGARSEWAAARDVLHRLGARPDLERLQHVIAGNPETETHGLSDRQLEVLRHVAAGRSNREIAEVLFISHRTVERHVSDIFTKLDVSSRTAATAYAYEHGLV